MSFLEDYQHTRKLVTELMDRGQWKHTWHMKKHHGSIDWEDEGNLDLIEEQVTVAMEEADSLLKKALIARRFVASQRQRLKEEQESE